jgi:methylphosphotriester-DNA--protein-cysteine methyltransferase
MLSVLSYASRLEEVKGALLLETQNCEPPKDCRPEQAYDPGVERVRRTCQRLDSDAIGTQTLAALSAQVNASPYHLQRTFKRVTGISPRQYAEARRLERVKKEVPIWKKEFTSENAYWVENVTSRRDSEGR